MEVEERHPGSSDTVSRFTVSVTSETHVHCSEGKSLDEGVVREDRRGWSYERRANWGRRGVEYEGQTRIE